MAMFQKMQIAGVFLGTLLLGVTPSFSACLQSIEGDWDIYSTPSDGSQPFYCNVELTQSSAGVFTMTNANCKATAINSYSIQSITMSCLEDNTSYYGGEIALTINGNSSVVNLQGTINQNGNLFVAISTDNSPPFYTMQFIAD
jgi:hypothetical protein